VEPRLRPFAPFSLGFQVIASPSRLLSVGVGQAADADSGTPAELSRPWPSAPVFGFPAPNRPETLVAIAKWPDVRFDGSGGTNPARRFLTRLPVELRLRSGSSVIIPPFISHADRAVRIPGSISLSSSKRPVVTEAEQADPWLSKWNSCSGSRVSCFRRSD
jgi:hypothetical protein